MVEQIINKMEKKLITGEEFKTILGDLLKNAFHNKVQIQYVLKDKDGKEYTYGECGENEEQMSTECKLTDGYKVRVKIWQKNKEVEMSECERLFKSYWNDKLCDSVCGLPATSSGDLVGKCEYTINEWKKQGKTIAFVMMDLDHFKDVNSNYDYTTGSKVISQFSRVLFKAIKGRAILIHEHGDEFDMLFAFENSVQILDLMHSVYRDVKQHVFSDAEDVNLTMAIGTWLIDSEELIDFRCIREKAENAYHPKKKNETKQRNSIRIAKNNNLPAYGDNLLETGMLRILGNIYNNQLFHNVYLDYIPYLISNMSSLSNVQLEVTEYLQWINPQYGNGLRVTIPCENWDTSVDISYIDIGFAVLQGILRNENINGKSISFQVKEHDVIIMLEDETILHYSHESIQGTFEWKQKEYYKISEGVETKKTVLVQAGYATKIKLPEDIFYRIVRVDARPFLGGGLPDLWAATLSALINSMNDNSNFNDIVIYGDVQNIKNVMEYLKTIKQWSEERIRYISKKTYKAEGDILKFQKQFGDHIQEYIEEEELVRHLYDNQKDVMKINQREKVNYNEKKRFMVRTLPYEKLQLEITDGCRTDTISHAFPIALEILRNRYDAEKEITDQAGRKLLELTDFKILLENPKNEKLPEYYLYDEKILDDYYRDVFEKEDGLFRVRLEKNNQIEEMIKHVVSTIGREKAHATRRAILVVQNEIQNEGNYSPLGLVSIWLAPRFVEQKVVIDYSYTWRTVEAIVGLPLSMYASVKFAEDITEKIAVQVTDKLYEVEMGQVSYIAHSLHMFTDEESMNIVRGIINEVSV